MERNDEIAICSVIASVVLWFFVEKMIMGDLNALLIVAACVVTMFSIGFGLTVIIKKINKKCSSYIVFGIVNIIVEIIIVGYSLYDLTCSTGMLAGLSGILMLVFLAPIPVVLMLIDYILYRRNKKRDNVNINNLD